MPIKEIIYAINGHEVTTPSEQVWTPIVEGDALTGRQKRSPYWRLEWYKQLVNACLLDWFDYDNTTLDSLSCPPPGELDTFVTYYDAICQSVSFRQRLSRGTEVVAAFLVFVGV